MSRLELLRVSVPSDRIGFQLTFEVSETYLDSLMIVACCCMLLPKLVLGGVNFDPDLGRSRFCSAVSNEKKKRRFMEDTAIGCFLSHSPGGNQ